MTEEGDKKNPKKRKLIENPLDKEETKENNMENEVPFSFYSLLNIEKTASIEEIVNFHIFFYLYI